jgi:hypothetical protein
MRRRMHTHRILAARNFFTTKAYEEEDTYIQDSDFKKFLHYKGKMDLLWRQKRPTMEAKKT